MLPHTDKKKCYSSGQTAHIFHRYNKYCTSGCSYHNNKIKMLSSWFFFILVSNLHFKSRS